MFTLQDFEKQVEPYKNTLVITGSFMQVACLIGVTEDQFGFYWLLDTREGLQKKTTISKWLPLKAFLPEKEYEMLIENWNLDPSRHKAI